MPVFLLDEECNFPDPSLANKDGLLAIGGDLSVGTLLKAYSKGIFPWFSEESPILWWSPDPRLALFPEKLKISKSLRQVIKSGRFSVSYDTRFEEVITHCAMVPRKGQNGTWITGEIIEGYLEFHRAGYAHSVEVFSNGRLAGGLYGVALGRVFFGESMFHLERDASKVALVYLVGKLLAGGFRVIDAQQKTRHLMSLGAELISRDRFLEILGSSAGDKLSPGKWQ